MFNSKITAEYIQNEINEAWAQCNKSDEKEYVKVFKSVNEEKTLLYAKRIITETKPVSYDLDIVEFPKEINNVYVITTEDGEKYYNLEIQNYILRRLIY